eukprot:3382082-Amphidinium_carterae.1
MGLFIQAQCVYSEAMRSAASSMETAATLKGSSKAFSHLLRAFEEQTRGRDGRSIREAIAGDVLIVRAAVDTIITMIEGTGQATDVVLATKAGSQMVAIHLDAQSLSQGQLSREVGLKASEALLKLGIKASSFRELHNSICSSAILSAILDHKRLYIHEADGPLPEMLAFGLATAINDILFHSKEEVSSSWQRLRSVPTLSNQAGARSHLGHAMRITHLETTEILVKKAVGEALAGFKSRILDAVSGASKALPAMLGLSAAGEMIAGVDTKNLRSSSSAELAKGLVCIKELCQNSPQLELVREAKIFLGSDVSRTPTLAAFVELLTGVVAASGMTGILACATVRGDGKAHPLQ